MRTRAELAKNEAFFRQEYEAVREHPARFLVRRGHVQPKVEEVVRRRRRYAIVEKVDRVARTIVRRLNPRPSPVK